MYLGTTPREDPSLENIYLSCLNLCVRSLSCELQCTYNIASTVEPVIIHTLLWMAQAMGYYRWKFIDQKLWQRAQYLPNIVGKTYGFCPWRGMGYGLLETYGLWYAFPHPPSWWTGLAMGYHRLWVFTASGMGYDRFDCMAIGAEIDEWVRTQNDVGLNIIDPDIIGFAFRIKVIMNRRSDRWMR